MNPVSLFDMEAMAKEVMPHNKWTFVDAGAADEITMRRNREAFDEITVNARFLVDVGNRDLSIEVLGEKISFPVMIAPAGSQRDVHPDGERATAAAAGSMGTLYTLPTGSGYSIEEVAEVSTGPLWFQLYHFDDDVTELLVTRAKSAGYKAIVLTVDTPTPSPKERDVRNNYRPTPGLHMGSLLRPEDRSDMIQRKSVGIPDMTGWAPPGYSGMTWERLDWLRELTGLPLVIKGIRTLEDAVACAEYGVDAIVVSNHGGRQLDCTRASIETLPEIVGAVGDSLEVYLDSGVRRGMDVLKAIALGARGVFVGRPLFWGLANGGEEGVRTMLEIIREEFDRALSYTGCRKVSDISRGLVSLNSDFRTRVQV